MRLLPVPPEAIVGPAAVTVVDVPAVVQLASADPDVLLQPSPRIHCDVVDDAAVLAL